MSQKRTAMVLVSPQRPSRGFASWLVISRSVSSSTSRRKLQVARNLGLAGQSNLWPEAQRAGNRTLALASFAAVLQPLQDPIFDTSNSAPDRRKHGHAEHRHEGRLREWFPLPQWKCGFRQAGRRSYASVETPFGNCCLSTKRGASATHKQHSQYRGRWRIHTPARSISG